MDPIKLPFNALIVGPTNSGKTQYLLNQLRGSFRRKFDYIVLFCPTFVKNTTDDFVDNDPRIFVIVCQQHEIEDWLKLASYFFEKTNTLFVLDDCAPSKRRERPHEPAGQSWFQRTPRRHQLVGLDPADNQHRQNRLGKTWQRSCFFTLLQAKQRKPSSKTMPASLLMRSNNNNNKMRAKIIDI